MADNQGKALSPRRNVAIDRPKLYEELLLKETSAKGRTNEPMHAILEAELGENGIVDGLEGQSIRNHALIHYLATLANSNNTNDTFDFDFVESLLKNGADVNSTDKTGQTIFHEIARSWNIDVVTFLLKHGANVNKKDHFGRSPLHVAAAVDYADMVEFLLQHGADINIRTIDEGQTPIHFAAKNDAINSLQMLLAYGADIDSRDSKNRTPLQVSAQMNRSRAAKHLINEGAPVGVYDDVGNSALSLLIEKIPDVALEALDQFHSSDSISRKHFYFLNYLEGTKLKEVKTNARTSLEIAVQNKRFEIILHPVMQRLIGVKWRMYGKRGAILDLVLNLFYTILWSVLAVTLPKTGNEMYYPLKDNSWRVVIGILLILFTILEIKIQVTNTVKTRREFTAWREWRASELERDFEYCHPRWPQETEYLQSEVKGVRNLSFITDSDWWIYFDWVALVLILATIVSHVTFFHYSTVVLKEVHEYITIALLLILWLRIFKYARPFEGAGPFVVIFGSVLGDILKWAFLNLVIIIPYTCAFWIIFGANSPDPVPSYSSFSPLLYNMFSMMVVNDHDYDKLERANPTMARLLCGTFIVIAAIITLNLLIALLSNTFERHYENAVANAVMQRARTILLLQKSLRHKEKTKYYDFIRLNGSPEVIRNDIGRFTGPDVDERATIERVREDVETVKNILGERLGSKFGKNGKKSDMEFVKMDVCKLRVCQEELVTDTRNMKMALHAIKETIEFLKSNGNNNNSNNNNNNNSNSNNNGNDNSNSNDCNSNAVSIPEKIPYTTTSTVVKPTFTKKKTLGMKLGKNEKNSAKEYSETESSSNTRDSSESSSENETKKNRSKKSHKNQDYNESSPKKKKAGLHSDDDDNNEVSTKKLDPSNKENGDYLGHQQFAYPPGVWQDSWHTNGVARNMGNHTYTSYFNQSRTPLSPFRRDNVDHYDEDNQPGFQAHREAQLYFNEFNQRFQGRRHENEFSNSRPVVDGRYRRVDENQNIQNNQYNIQRVGGRRFSNTRAHQPIILPTRDHIDYPRNVYQNPSVQNNQRVPTGQYFERAGGRQNDGYDEDEWRNQRESQQFSSNDFGHERYTPKQSGFTNYRYESVEGDVPTSKPNNQSMPYRDNSAWSEERKQTQGPGYQEMDSQTNSYHAYATVSPKMYPAFALARPPPPPPPPRKSFNTITQDDRRISPISKSPSERESQVVISGPYILPQSQLFEFSDNSQWKLDETRENSHRMPSVTEIQDTPKIRIQHDSVSPRYLPSPTPTQITENQNTTLKFAPPVILSHRAPPMSPKIMRKVEYFERRPNLSETKEIHSTGISSQASFRMQSHGSSETEFQSALSGHGQPRPAISTKQHEKFPGDSEIYPEYPTTTYEIAEVASYLSTVVPPVNRQDEIDDKGTGEETGEAAVALGQGYSEEMLRMANQTQNVTLGAEENDKRQDNENDYEKEDPSKSAEKQEQSSSTEI